jgi:beta-galactosidase
LRYAPFSIPFEKAAIRNWGDLRIDGYIKDKKVISKSYSGRGVDRKFVAVADDHELLGDGADTTRVVLRVTDEFDRVRPIANDPIVFELSGPGQIIGDNPFALTGGTGAIWIRATERPGTIGLRAKHPRLGTRQIEIKVAATAPENV